MTDPPPSLALAFAGPSPIRATTADLPPAVAAALAAPTEPRAASVDACGIAWATFEWGRPTDPAIVLLHGVGSSARTWWRIGPALAALGRHVVAPDLPGHGRTGSWLGHHRFADHAADVAAFLRAAGLADAGRSGSAAPVVGHSWGAVTAAWLPPGGHRPERIVLLDPPAVPLEAIGQMADDPLERHHPSLEAALIAVASAYPEWSTGDQFAKAEGLTQVDEGAVRRVLRENGDWDGGLAALAYERSIGIPAWLIRGDPAAGGLVPDAAFAAFAERLGPDRCLTVAGGPHSPQRQFPEATLAALLRALG